MARETPLFNFSFRCNFPGEDGPNYSVHKQRMKLSDYQKWIQAYRFTHPNVMSIDAKVWFNESEIEYPTFND